MYTQKRLITISLVLYVVSLSLPAVGRQLGIMVMITGVAFGWWGLLVGIIPGVAAYANVFYLWSVFRLLEGRQPVAAMTVCMLISGFTLLLPIMPLMYGHQYRPAKKGEQGEQIQFIQKADGQTVWQALMEMGGSGQYPDYSEEITRLWQPPLHTEIIAGFKANPAQTFIEACPIEPYSAPLKLHELLQIDGKIYSDKYRSPVAKSRILCNPEYILWLNAPEYWDFNGSIRLSTVLIRRSDMLPVEKFSTSREKGDSNYDAFKQASEQPQAWLAGISRMETRRRDENGYGDDDYELVLHS